MLQTPSRRGPSRAIFDAAAPSVEAFIRFPGKSAPDVARSVNDPGRNQVGGSAGSGAADDDVKF